MTPDLPHFHADRYYDPETGTVTDMVGMWDAIPSLVEAGEGRIVQERLEAGLSTLHLGPQERMVVLRTLARVSEHMGSLADTQKYLRLCAEHGIRHNWHGIAFAALAEEANLRVDNEEPSELDAIISLMRKAFRGYLSHEETPDPEDIEDMNVVLIQCYKEKYGGRRGREVIDEIKSLLEDPISDEEEEALLEHLVMAQVPLDNQWATLLTFRRLENLEARRGQHAKAVIAAANTGAFLHQRLSGMGITAALTRARLHLEKAIESTPEDPDLPDAVKAVKVLENVVELRGLS